MNYLLYTLAGLIVLFAVFFAGFMTGGIKVFQEIFIRLIWTGTVDIDNAISLIDKVKSKPSESNKGEGVELTLEGLERIKRLSKRKQRLTY